MDEESAAVCEGRGVIVAVDGDSAVGGTRGGTASRLQGGREKEGKGWKKEWYGDRGEREAGKRGMRGEREVRREARKGDKK